MKFAPYVTSAKPPHIHPMIHIITKEWKAAATDQQQPCWFISTDANIQCVCEQVKKVNPKWHMDLYAHKRLCNGPRPLWARSMFVAMHGDHGVYTFRWCYYILIKTPCVQVDVV